MRVGLIIGFLAVLLIGSSIDVKDPSEDYYQVNMTKSLNEARNRTSIRNKIPNMHRLDLDPVLCQRLRNGDGSVLWTNYRYAMFHKSQYNDNYFDAQIREFEENNKIGEKNSLAPNETHGIGVECVVPAQKKVCCGKTAEDMVVCLFGPEGTLNSYNNKKRPGEPGSICDQGYVPYKGMCTDKSTIPSAATTNAPNSVTDAPNFYNEIVPKKFNEIRRTILIENGISDMYELVFDPELCQRFIPTKLIDGLWEKTRYNYAVLSYFEADQFHNHTIGIVHDIMDDKYNLTKQNDSFGLFEIVVPAQKKVCCQKYDKDYAVCLFGPEGTLNSWNKRHEGPAGTECDYGYEGYNGLCTNLLRIPSPATNNSPKPPTFYNETLPRVFNEIRRGVAIKKNISNMYELVFDPVLCKNHTFSEDSRGIIFPNQFVDFVEETNIFLEKETQILIPGATFGVVSIIPAQKKVCCEQINVTTIECGFGPERGLDSWTNRQTGEPPGSKCDPCYENYRGLCRKKSKKPIRLSTTIIDPNPERDAPHFYNKTLPSAFNDIRRITAIYERILNMYELVYDPELCRSRKESDECSGCVSRFIVFEKKQFNSEFLLNETENFLLKCKAEQDSILGNIKNRPVVGFEYIIPALKTVCCEEISYSDIRCSFEPDFREVLDSWTNRMSGIPGSCHKGYKNNTGLCAPDPSSSSDPPSEVTHIPLVYLRPTENPDLEKRLKKYLAEETDGDEPDDGDPLNEYEYYDDDSAKSISILVTVVFVCFFVLYNE